MKLSLIALAMLAATQALAEQPQPEPIAYPPPIPAPIDVARPGIIKLAVDITDLSRHIISVHETVPVATSGPFILLYPEWVPGDHGPTGPLNDLAGLVITAHGKTIPWVRDVVNVHAFHIDIPAGVTQLGVAFQYLSPVSEHEGRVEMTPNLVDMAWNTVALYPAGYYSRDVMFEPSLTLPKGWHYATALETAAATDGHISFKPTPFNTLVDSPLYAGQYYARFDLAPGAQTPVHLNVFADRPQDLAVTPDELAKHRALVHQAILNYGSQHYKHYDFLLELSDEMGGVGLEHHQSSEDGVGRDYFTGWDKDVADRDLMPHEYTHSWNGKFRRPADLWAPNFNVPERDSLLWVYEGQTQFWGQILAERSGLWTKQNALDAIALDAASMQAEIGRDWRPLQDTTNDPIINERRPQSWHSWERQEDYYTEGLLIWLDADSLIRAKTHNQKSLTDFAHLFFGVDNGSFITDPYTFQDVVAALNQVLPYDWADFLRTRLDRTGPEAPLDGITRGGYKLVYTDKPNPMLTSAESIRHAQNFTWSIGITLGSGGTITSVVWNSPADRAGLVKGGKIIAVNGLSYEDAADLSTAITLAKTSKKPISLIVQYDHHFQTVALAYHDGLRYPHLERVSGTTAYLDDLLEPLK